MKSHKLTFKIEMDEQKRISRIFWQSSEGDKLVAADAVNINIWDKNEKSNFALNLWTGEMQVPNMEVFCVNNLETMADMLENATMDGELAKEFRAFSKKMFERVEAKHRADNS